LVENINKVFICAYSRVFTQPELHQQIRALFTEQELFNLKLTFIDVNLVPLPITLTGKVAAHEDLSAIEATLSADITAKYGENAPIRTDESGNLIEIKTKDFSRFVDDLGLLVDFELAIPALATPRKLPDYRYIDVSTSTITIER